jgi:hypothetical protein
MIPYVITLLVLFFIGRSHAPAASGKIYDPAAGVDSGAFRRAGRRALCAV